MTDVMERHAVPERSFTQRMEALRAANDIRSRRAQLKRDLKAGRANIAELVLEPPEYIQTAKLYELMLACPKWGRVKVGKVFNFCHISPSKTIGGLSERQRREVAAFIARAPVVTRAADCPVVSPYDAILSVGGQE